MSMLTNTEYRIEVWEDIWDGSHWTEQRSVVIGANDMEYLGKATQATFVRSVTGEVKLSFTLEGKVYNAQTGQMEDNFLIPYLFNEVKIKLYCPQYNDGINNGWYDFIIKNVQETRARNIGYQYECEFLPINELAKTGQNLVFSLDLDNAIGRIGDLASAILDGSDWSYDNSRTNADLTEATEETLFSVVTNQSLTLQGMETTVGTPATIQVPSGTTLYVPYSELLITDNSPIQVIYVAGTTDNFILANGNIITNKLSNYTTTRNVILNLTTAPTKYRGYKIVVTFQTDYKNVSKDSAKIDFRYVTVYKKSGDVKTYYGFKETEKVTTDNAVTFNASANTVTKNNHGFVANSTVMFLEVGTSTAIQSYLLYYIINPTTNTFQLSTTSGGTVIDLLQDTTGKIADEIKVDQVQHYFYYDTSNKPVYVDDMTGLTPVIISGSEKYRTLEANQSNRFNLIQSLSELFEVWARFDVYHDNSGRIIGKKICFVDTIGSQNWAGFTYGVNLEGVTRTLGSKTLTTKMFVRAIENQNMANGACSIAYAKENTSKEEFLINLDYYVQQGMIDNTELTYDLYKIGNSTGIGYLTNLGRLNFEYDSYNNKAISLETYVSRYTELSAAMNDSVKALEVKIADIIRAYNNGVCSTDMKQTYDVELPKYQQKLATDTKLLNDYRGQLDSYNQQLKEANDAQADIRQQKKTLNLRFNTRYARFIQEGTWTGDTKYINDNAYYYDAQNVLLESARPAVEYSINVIDVSRLQGYEDFDYQIGDITYIEDVEFFGYTKPDLHGNIMPYREPVIISTIETSLDNAMETKITLRNYKNQFDDLFQRVTATVQNYSLNENIYQRANNFTTTGEITFDSLQASLLNNSLILSRSVTEDVLINKSGITLTDLEDKKKMVKIVSGGIFISDDGGVKWNSGITGNGINTKLLTAGQIDVGKVNIYNGAYPTFSWDSTGLYAYAYTGTPGSLTMDRTSFVRFNQNGILGQKSGNKMFSLDWNGLYLKTGKGIYEIQLGEHIINGTTYLFSAINNTTNTRTFSIDGNGNAYFAGELNATSGIFSGELRAASGTLNTITARNFTLETGTISGNVDFYGDISGASGTFTGNLSGNTITGSTIKGGRIVGTEVEGGKFWGANRQGYMTVYEDGGMSQVISGLELGGINGGYFAIQRLDSSAAGGRSIIEMTAGDVIKIFSFGNISIGSRAQNTKVFIDGALAIRQGQNYGTSFPSDPTEGQMFFMFV